MSAIPIKTQLHPVVKIIIIEFLRYWKYSFTTPVYIFLAIFPIVSAIALLLIGIEQLPAEFNYAPVTEIASTTEAVEDTRFNDWINSITKDNLYRWYWYVTLFLYGIGSLIHYVLKKLGHELKPWGLGKKLMIFIASILVLYAIPYGIFRIVVPGAIPIWVVAIFSAFVMVLGFITITVGHALEKLIAAISHIETTSPSNF